MPFRSGALAPGVAFVTGGARGLGNAIAVSFAKEGARGVALVDILDDAAFEEGKKNVEKYGAKCLTIRADVTKEADVERAVDEAVKEFGRIDYAANFAGIGGAIGMTHELESDGWRKVIDVNLIGVFLCNKYEIRQMLKQESLEVEEGRPPQRGSIVNCASVNSIQAGAGVSAYTASKHAVVGLTKTTALEVRRQGIRVNAISPGFLLTKIVDHFVQEDPAIAVAWKAYEDRQGRVAAFEEIGDAVVLLSLPRMSLVVAHNLVADGGFSVNENTV